MNPAILAQLFKAQQLNSSPPPLSQEPGPLQWGAQMPPTQQQSPDNDILPPSDYKYLDRVEGDDSPMGVMFGQDAGQPDLAGGGTNVAMSRLPPGAQEGQYISPLDIQSAPPPAQSAVPQQPPMGTMFQDPATNGVQWGPNPYPQQQPMPPITQGRRMSTRR